jgi:hypothetical protein
MHAFVSFFNDMVSSLGDLVKNYFSSNFSLHPECHLINVILKND